ncbi:MAG: DUF2203 domain-containing protein [candidate division Zixibacteria bacterium]|nr:DUF2203 domain-containing protein [candidate division Zixibacteria bacterium]
MANQFKKHFSLEEASELLPTLAKIFEEVQTIQEELEARGAERAEVLDSAKSNGGGKKADYHFAQNQKIQRLLDQVEKKGVLVKDLERGLVDFPHLLGGREVFLCWMLGEKKIEFWHDLESGFAGRQPL